MARICWTSKETVGDRRACARSACEVTSRSPVNRGTGEKSERKKALTTLAAAFPRLGSRADRATVGPRSESAAILVGRRLARSQRAARRISAMACGCDIHRTLRRDPHRRGALSGSRQSVRFRRGAGIRRAGAPSGTRRKGPCIPPRAIGSFGRSTSSRTNRPLRSQRPSRSETRKL